MIYAFLWYDMNIFQFGSSSISPDFLIKQSSFQTYMMSFEKSISRDPRIAPCGESERFQKINCYVVI